VPLFRLLARRWKPVVPLKLRRVARDPDDHAAPSRAWISKPRYRFTGDAKNAASKRNWNPWLWTK
jgi:hypothetical protein